MEDYESPKMIIGIDKAQYAKLRRLFDLIRRSKSRVRFKRQANLKAGQRWFLEGESAIYVTMRLLRGDPQDTPGLSLN
jgi:hypothetical protein